MKKMDYWIRFPDYYLKGVVYHHQLFNSFRTWLESKVGKQHEDWDYIPGDIHAYGVCFVRQEDLTAFLLKFDVKQSSVKNK